MEKKKAHLENWLYSLNEFGTPVLFGVVSGHSRIPDGTEVRTSKVLSIDAQARTAETMNTTYTLGRSREDNSNGEITKEVNT